MSDIEQLSKLAESAIGDPILLRKLCDRLVDMMREDMRNQKDRSGYSRRVG